MYCSQVGPFSCAWSQFRIVFHCLCSRAGCRLPNKRNGDPQWKNSAWNRLVCIVSTASRRLPTHHNERVGMPPGWQRRRAQTSHPCLFSALAREHCSTVPTDSLLSPFTVAQSGLTLFRLHWTASGISSVLSWHPTSRWQWAVEQCRPRGHASSALR